MQLLGHPRRAGTLAQARASGREGPVGRMLEALAVGAREGQRAGLAREAELFAEAVCDPASGPPGIRAFLEKRSAPLPLRHVEVPPDADEDTRQRLEAEGRLLPLEAPFFPGVTPIPEYQYGMGVTKDPSHGLPPTAIRRTPRSCWCSRRRSPGRTRRWSTCSPRRSTSTTSGRSPASRSRPSTTATPTCRSPAPAASAWIAALGEELVREGRLAVGPAGDDLLGQSELLSPDQGLDPMAADFHIQGYEINDGSHAQFLVVQGPQLHPKLPGLTIEEAGLLRAHAGHDPSRPVPTSISSRASGCSWRARHRHRARVPARRAALRASTWSAWSRARSAPSGCAAFGGGAGEPEGPTLGRHLHAGTRRAGRLGRPGKRRRAFVAEVGPGRRPDRLRGLACRRARLLALLPAPGRGRRADLLRRTSGYRFSFMGKPGEATGGTTMLRAPGCGPAGAARVYGPGADDGIVDEARSRPSRSAAPAARAWPCSPTRSAARVRHLAGLRRPSSRRRQPRGDPPPLGDDFDPPGPLAPLPDPFTESAAFKEAVRRFSDRTLKPIGSAIAPLLRYPGSARPARRDLRARRSRRPRARHSLVKPNVGVVVYAEDLAGRRFSFYAPQVWMRQRRILMPTAEIRGTHLNTAREFAEVQERIAAGMIDVVPPVPVPLEELAEAHQAMWENRTPARPTWPCTACRARPEDPRRALPRLGHPRRAKRGEELSPDRHRLSGDPTMTDAPMTNGGGGRLAGRTVILTGAAGNIGSFISRRAAARGRPRGDDRAATARSSTPSSTRWCSRGLSRETPCCRGRRRAPTRRPAGDRAAAWTRFGRDRRAGQQRRWGRAEAHPAGDPVQRRKALLSGDGETMFEAA
jgi:acrylyl-CoA reductase (NADPH)/3-hydroxypropionyl-CoA dehydratase/3-hydroxypropionyl-CoA synthetase